MANARNIAGCDDKYPDEKIYYSLDWSRALGERTIASSAWTIPAGVTEFGSDSFTDTSTTVGIQGGTDGTTYTIENDVTLSTGEILKAAVTLTVTDA